MHAFSHTSYHIYIISHTGIHSTDTQQHRDATHTYTRTYIHAQRCMYMSRYVAYLLHPFIVFFIGALCRGPFWRIWAAERPRRSTLERHHMGRSVLPDSGSPEGKTEHETHCQGDNEHNSGEGYPTPPHPTQPKPDPSSVRVFASESERYYPTPPHPTKARPQLSARVCKRN